MRKLSKRFERIYEELGVVQASNNVAFKRHSSKPLLSATVAFGEKVRLLTPKADRRRPRVDREHFEDYDGYVRR